MALPHNLTLIALLSIHMTEPRKAKRQGRSLGTKVICAYALAKMPKTNFLQEQ